MELKALKKRFDGCFSRNLSLTMFFPVCLNIWYVICIYTIKGSNKLFIYISFYHLYIIIRVVSKTYYQKLNTLYSNDFFLKRMRGQNVL